MAKSQNLQTSFASGELSPLILGRTDLEQYYKGAQTAEGVVIVPQGGVKRRPALEYIADSLTGLARQTDVNPTMPNGGTGSAINDGVLGGTETNAGVTATSPWTIAQYDFGATYRPDWMTIGGIKLNYVTFTTDRQTADVNLEYSSDGASWTTYKTFEINSDFWGGRDRRWDVTGIAEASRRYWRITTDLGNEANWKVFIRAFEAHIESGSASSPKLFEWNYAADHHFLAVLTPLNLRIYRAPHAGSNNTVYVADIPVPYQGGYGNPVQEVYEVRACQTENVMLMFHEDHQPFRIVFDGTDSVDAFTGTYINFANTPKYDFNDDQSPAPVSAIQEVTFSGFSKGERYEINIEGVTSKTIVYGGDSDADEQATTANNLRQNILDMPVVGFNGVNVERVGNHTYRITLYDESAGDYNLFSGYSISDTGDTLAFEIIQQGSPREEFVFSDTRGYPKSGVFYNGRLWLGGSKSKPQSLFASRAGHYLDFYLNSGLDDEAIFVTIDAKELTNIVALNPDRGLQVFTSGAEFIVKGDTPATITVEPQTQHGTYNTDVQSIDGSTLFLDRNGNTLRQYLFNFNEDSFIGTDISVLSSQLIDQPKDFAILKGDTSQDANYVFIINQDGNGSVLNTLRSQDINGFTRWTSPTGMILQSCCATDDELYVNASLSAGGSGGTNHIFRWNFNYLLDAGVKTTVTATGSDVVVSVGAHLSGFTVGVLADGNVLPDRACTGATGDITITAAELAGFTTRNLEVGLNVAVTVKPMPLNTAGPGGQNTMKRKKIVRMNLRVRESAGVQIDGNDVPVRKLGEAEDSPLNTPYTPRTGIIQDDNGGNGWDVEVVPEITVPSGTPFHLQAIGYEVSSS